MKVLIVDDEPLIRRSLRRAFEFKQHQVAEAENGVQGLAEWEKFKPDLIVIDVLMPGMTGPEMIESASAALRNTTKIVIMSAFTGDFTAEKLKSLGALRFFSKPFEDIFQLANEIEKL